MEVAGEGQAVPPDKRAALRDKMKQLMQSKARAAGAPSAQAGSSSSSSAPPPPAAAGAAAGNGAAGAAAAPPPAEADEDPWPDIRLSATPLGLADGRSRAAELQRRGDFDSVALLWDKLWYLGRRCAPPLTSEELRALARERCEVLALLERWASAERACGQALGEAALEDSDAARVLLWRARARAERRGDLEGARADVEEAGRRARGCTASCREEVQEETEELESRLHELREQQLQEAQRCTEPLPSASAASSTAAASAAVRPSAARGAAATSAAAAAAAALSRPQGAAARGQWPACPSGGGLAASAEGASEAAKRNQAFFNKMERAFVAECADDGWDEIRRCAEDLEEEPTGVRLRGKWQQIPADSDYHSVRVPKGFVDRQLRRSPGAPAANAAREPGAQPRRNLDELRRVEAATRKAVEEELARQAAERAGDGAGVGAGAAPGGCDGAAAAAPPPRPRVAAARKERKPRRINLDSISDDEPVSASSSGGDDDVGSAAGCHPGGDAPLERLPSAAGTAAAVAGGGSGPSPPIRTRSEAVRVESLEDSDESDEEQQRICRNAQACVDALEEFHRIGREKEELLARWRDRWG